jgi:two-component system nitrate/nitrite response regulator NarL
VTADIRVFVCENHPIVVDGLSWLFRKCDGIQLVGSAFWEADTIERIVNSKPDVLFFDYRQLQESCVSPMDVRRAMRDVKFVVFSAGVTVMETMQALDYGAAGVLQKSAPLHRIEDAVRRVAAGDNYLDEGIARTLAFYSGRPQDEGHAGL